MYHQPFEEWLLDEEPLTLQAERELQIHLRSCTRCAAIAASNLALRSRRLTAPEADFTGRFRLRLAAWQRRQLRRQAIGTVVLVVVGLTLLYVLLGPAMLEAARSPAAVLGQVTAYLVDLLALASVVGEVGSILLRNLRTFIHPETRIALYLALGGFALLWTLTMRRLARLPQGV
ncbi:MAG TPA: hypothetical protein VLL49_00685 [Anaerolineales bacterium]|nr:hypothetical protein [Anaerolineales bacterium]